MKWLAAAEQKNNFTALRFLAATAVIWFHSFALTLRADEEPLFRLMSGAYDVGVLGVLAFFAISGFLVTKSFTERGSWSAFLIARALRIYPGLFAATLFTVLVGAIWSTLPVFAYLSDPATHAYLWHTATGWNVRHSLPGTFLTNPYPHSVNGSLWTLPIELKMYAACLATGVLTLFYRRWLFNVCFFAGIALFAWHPEWFPVNPGMWIARQLGLAFACGAFVWVNREWVPLNLPTAAAAVALLALTPRSVGLVVAFVPLFTYLVLWLALTRPFWTKRWPVRGDYSYGLYIYAFPIQQGIIATWPSLHPLAVFGFAFPCTLAVSFASWHLIERRALLLKPRLISRRGRRSQGAVASVRH